MTEIINWKLVPEDEHARVLIGCVTLNKIFIDCNFDIKVFHKTIIYKGIKEKYLKSDFDVKRFVWHLIDMPFEYEKMNDEQLKFLRAIHKRYFSIPLRYKIKDYLKEQKQVKYN